MKVMVVDDSRFSRNMIVQALRQGGYETYEACDGAEALEKLTTERPDCILTDLLMPVLDGFGLLEQLRLRGETIPVMVLSADIQGSSRSRSSELGAVHFLNKPLQAPALLAAMAQVCPLQEVGR